MLLVFLFRLCSSLQNGYRWLKIVCPFVLRMCKKGRQTKNFSLCNYLLVFVLCQKKDTEGVLASKQAVGLYTPIFFALLTIVIARLCEAIPSIVRMSIALRCCWSPDQQQRATPTMAKKIFCKCRRHDLLFCIVIKNNQRSSLRDFIKRCLCCLLPKDTPAGGKKI